MSKGVSKQCSILNYLRRTDEELHELLQDLCIGKMLIPHKGSPGITFLRPNKALFNEIQTMAAGDEPEKAIEALQSLVLLDSLPNIGDFDDKKSDIPTYLRKKLPVTSVDGKKVVLSNGAEIVPDKDFQARSDRGNINVYIISNALVPADGPDADFSNAKPKAKKGGADLGVNRSDLFHSVLKCFCESKRDPAMELLAALYGWASSAEISPDLKPSCDKLAKAIKAKASGDTLATLAIILQPYKPGNPDYLDENALVAFKTAMYGMDNNFKDGETFKNIPSYTMNPNAKELYEGLCESKEFEKVAENIRAVSGAVAANFAKLNAVKLLTDFYRDKMPKIVKDVDCVLPSRSTVFAEAELRVVSATILENSDGVYDFDELCAVYQNFKLDKPYMCADTDLIKGANLGFYYSTVYLIARSDALFHVPSMEGNTVKDKIASDVAFISLNKTVFELLQSRRKGSHDLLESYKRAW